MCAVEELNFNFIPLIYAKRESIHTLANVCLGMPVSNLFVLFCRCNGTLDRAYVQP